jgi:hypothetical protein
MKAPKAVGLALVEKVRVPKRDHVIHACWRGEPSEPELERFWSPMFRILLDRGHEMIIVTPSKVGPYMPQLLRSPEIMAIA